MKFIFIGTSKFAAIILEKLIENKYKPVLAISAPDKPIGRKGAITPPEVKTVALKNEIPVIQPVKIKDAELEIKKINPDLIILAAYGQIIPESILSIPRYGSFNIHPSLLPKYRGASPIQSAILNGDEKTGVTIYLMDKELDHGPVLAQKQLKITDRTGYFKLLEELAELGSDLLLESIPRIVENKAELIPQNESKASFVKILTKEDGYIKWNKTAEEIERQIRAYENWPTSYSFWDKKALKIIESSAKILPVEKIYPFGKVVVSPENEILVATKENYLKIEKLQIEGKKPMSAKDFLNGYSKIIGSILK
jgi:methionyl-tRNA formyltransferase